MQISVSLCDRALFTGRVEEWQPIPSPPCHVWLGIALDEALEGHIGADVRCRV